MSKNISLSLAIFVAAAVFVFGCEPVKQQVPKEEFFNYSVHFCSQENCLAAIAGQLSSAHHSVKCAFYRIDDNVIKSIPHTAAAEVAVDENAKITVANFANTTIRKADSKGIMHNKYCIIDGITVITGSFNPTAAAKNDYNDLLVINSTALAAFYSSNFEKLKHSGKNRTLTAAAVANSKLTHKATVLNNTAVEVYFCPEDGCAEAVKERIRTANSSIVFAAYSFTHPEIANELIIKKSEGVAVAGVIEKSTAGSQYSKHTAMAANGVKVRLESSRLLMHHKFFVIDNETVITGSFNPTRNADERNDENLIVINNNEIAGKYAEAFTKIYGGNDDD